MNVVFISDHSTNSVMNSKIVDAITGRALYEITTQDMSARGRGLVGYRTIVYSAQEEGDSGTQGPDPMALWERTRDTADRSEDRIVFRGKTTTLGEWLLPSREHRTRTLIASCEEKYAWEPYGKAAGAKHSSKYKLIDVDTDETVGECRSLQDDHSTQSPRTPGGSREKLALKIEARRTLDLDAALVSFVVLAELHRERMESHDFFISAIDSGGETLGGDD